MLMGSGSNRYAVILTVIFLIAASGCSRHAGNSGAMQVSSAAKASVSTYPLRGVVLGKADASQRITVHQGAIRGFMPETNEVYTIADKGLFQQLKPGDAITADLLAPSNSDQFRLENVKVVAEPRGGSALASLPAHRLLIGERVPDIPLVNQDGKTINLQQFKGKAVLITFIDTQCTDDCPIITGLFSRVNTLLRGDPVAYADSKLISVSIDPKFDTPPVLWKYGLKYLHDNSEGFSHWEFTDLTPEHLKRLAAAFGVMYAPSPDGDIVHTMQTALIAPDGTVAQLWPGDKWDPKVIARAVETSSLKYASESAVNKKQISNKAAS
jgi:protein SCO1